MTGKLELMSFILTFLNCTWYIKNPFLKAKINDVSPKKFSFEAGVSILLQGIVYEHLGLWIRETRRFGKSSEYSSRSTKTSNASVDAFLHW